MEHVDKGEFIEICEHSVTMSEAAQKLKLHFNTFKRYAISFGCYKPNQGRKGLKYDNTKSRFELLQKILSGNYPTYETFKLKNLLLEFHLKENKCERCGISEWNGEPIHCELHHKDGDRFNHMLYNLQVLCPNCHSQTKTFRSKNIKKKLS